MRRKTSAASRCGHVMAGGAKTRMATAARERMAAITVTPIPTRVSGMSNDARSLGGVRVVSDERSMAWAQTDLFAGRAAGMGHLHVRRPQAHSLAPFLREPGSQASPQHLIR